MVLKVSPAISNLNQLTCLELSVWNGFQVHGPCYTYDIALPPLNALTALKRLLLGCLNAEIDLQRMPRSAILRMNYG